MVISLWQVANALMVDWLTQRGLMPKPLLQGRKGLNFRRRCWADNSSTTEPLLHAFCGDTKVSTLRLDGHLNAIPRAKGDRGGRVDTPERKAGRPRKVMFRRRTRHSRLGNAGP